MDANDLRDLSVRSREDGERLYRVATAIFDIWRILIKVAAGIGGLITLGLLIAALDAGHMSATYLLGALGMALGTAVFCAINHAMAVLSTHLAKVAVHILYTNLALVEARGEGPK